jgi:hypothetical protein
LLEASEDEEITQVLEEIAMQEDHVLKKAFVFEIGNTEKCHSSTYLRWLFISRTEYLRNSLDC